jgi:membrane protein implicated in regulation of membrane protease activity
MPAVIASAATSLWSQNVARRLFIRHAMVIPTWVELVIFVVVTALAIVLIWHFPKIRRKSK